MAGLHNLMPLITVITMLISVYSMQIQRFPYMRSSQDAGIQQFSDSFVVKDGSVKNFDSPSSQEDGILYLDRIGQRKRIERHSPIIQSDSNGPIIPESCKHSTYCEEVINYPEEVVSNLIATLGEGSLQIDKLHQPDFTQMISSNETKLCKVQERVTYPRAGLGDDNELHFIVNGKNESNKQQGFAVKICVKEECNCSSVLVFQDGYRGRCKQSFIYRTATAFRMTNSTHAEQYQTYIKLPSCCECVAEQCTNDCDDQDQTCDHGHIKKAGRNSREDKTEAL